MKILDFWRGIYALYTFQGVNVQIRDILGVFVQNFNMGLAFNRSDVV